MAEFDIKTQPVNQEADNISDLSRQFKNNSEDLSHVVSALGSLSSKQISGIIKRLNKAKDRMTDEAVRMNSLGEALFHIVSTYQNTERTLINGNDVTEDANDSLGGTIWGGIQAFIKKIKKIIDGLIKAREEEIAREKEAEKQQDLYMQAEIFSLLDSERFSKATWEKAGVEERKKILSEFLKELEKIYDVDVNDKIEFSKSLGASTNGAYSQYENKVLININRLSAASSYKIMQTMIHEMRHCYQYNAIKNPSKYKVSAETVSKWKENYAHYKSTSNGYTYEEYVSQPIEWDAKNFAKQYDDIVNADPEYMGSWG